jgi:hypothetical protein
LIIVALLAVQEIKLLTFTLYMQNLSNLNPECGTGGEEENFSGNVAQLGSLVAYR